MIHDISEILRDIPQLDIPDIKLSGVPDLFSDSSEISDIFSRRKAWHDVSDAEPRCDFSPRRWLLKPKKPIFILALWRRSEKGPTLKQIKADESYIDFVANHTMQFIRQAVGNNLDTGDWALTTPPPRRHKEQNFAQSVAAIIAQNLNIRFYDNVFEAKNKQRVNPSFSIVDIPKEANIILYDDIVTTGSTMQACFRTMNHLNKNIIFFTSISNE